MKCWDSACLSEKKQFEAISLILHHNQNLLKFLFDPHSPKLLDSPVNLMRQARHLSSSDYLLIKICLDIWCEQGQVQVHELFNLEPDHFNLTLNAFKYLGS